MEEIFFSLSDDKILTTLKNRLDLCEYIIKNSLASQFSFIMKNLKNQKNMLIEISKYIQIDQLDIIRSYTEHNDELLSEILINISPNLVKPFIKTFNSQKCLDIINSVHHSDEQIPTFLETCISLDYPQVKGYFYKYFCYYTVEEIKVFFNILDKESTKEAMIYCQFESMKDIIPTLDCLKVREIIKVIPESILIQIFSKLAKDKQIFSFSNLSVEQFWKILPTLSTQQLYEIIPFISYAHKMDIIENYFEVSDTVFQYSLETQAPYIIAIGFSFIQTKSKLIKNAHYLTRQQLWISIPVMDIEDIFEVLNILSESKIQIIVNNITQKQIEDIQNDLMLNLNILGIKEKFLKNNTDIFDKELESLERRIEINEVLLVESEIRKIQKNYLNLLNKKYELKKNIQKYENFVDKIGAKYKTIFNILLKSVIEIFSKICDFQKRIDKGDSVNGVLNKLITLKNKEKINNPSIESDSILTDERIVSNYDEIWNIYNNAREIFEKIFGKNKKIDDINLSWEDLINNNLTTEQSYEAKNIKTLEDLKMYITSRNNVI